MVDPIGTCQALDLLTQDQLEQLFDNENGYLSKVDEIFDTVQIKEFQTDNEEASEHESTHNEDTSKKRRKHKHRRTSSVVVDKKCLILDVDNTLIYVRHFMDEMRVGDKVKLGDKDAIVTKLTYRLDLEFSENPGQMRSYDHVLKSKDDTIPQRGEWFPDEQSKVAIIHQADPTGCVIRLVAEAHDDEHDDGNQDEDEHEHEHEHDDSKEKDDEEEAAAAAAQNGHNGHSKDEDEETNKTYNGREVEISFLQNSDELSQLEPMMHRENYLAVTFMYGGYLVRIRPGLGEFLALCNAKYDVILFTAADGSVYQGLLKQVHHILKTDLDEMRAANEIDCRIPKKLWQKIYFRNDCDEKFDEYGLPYRHKNLAKLGRELSTIVMVDDNPLSYRGFEPNSVRVAGFWGLSQPADNELMQTLFPTLWMIADHKDVRYHLSGLGQPPPEIQSAKNVLEPHKEPDAPSDDEDILTKQRRHSRNASQKFLHHLREAIVAENESLEGTPTDDEEDDDAEVGHQHENGSTPHEAPHQQTNSSEKDQTLSPPMEQTPGYNSDDADPDDGGSVDSISSEKMDELERRGTFHEKQQQTAEDAENKSTEHEDSHEMNKRKNSGSSSRSPDPFAAGFDDVADKVADKYNSMAKEESQSYESSGVDVTGADPVQDPQQNNSLNNTNPPTDGYLSDQQLDDIFSSADTTNPPATNTNIVDNTETAMLPRQGTNVTESGIGDAGTLIFDSYDEDVLLRDAYESPHRKAVDFFQETEKRPSIELDLDAVQDATNGSTEASNQYNERDVQSDSRPTAPNSPAEADTSPSTKELLARTSQNENEEAKATAEQEAEDDEEEDSSARGNRGDYVLSPQQTGQRSASTSSTKGVSHDLLNTHTDDSKETDPTNGFISIQESIEMGNTGSRPSRTPTPVRDDDAEILIEKSTGCSCFGWFGKKKKKTKSTNGGLAHQDGLR